MAFFGSVNVSQVVFKCQQSCNSNCVLVNNLLKESLCPALCVDHCMTYDRVVLSNEQVKCLLMCKYLKYDQKSVCEPLCKVNYILYQPVKIDEDDDMMDVRAVEEPTGNVTVLEKKKDVSNECTGYGRELCYKICRLHHSEPIEMCLCACCKCKF